MGFQEVQTLDADNTIAIGGVNRKTGKKNPTKAEGYFLGTRLVESKKSKSGKAAIHFLQTPEGNLGVWGKTDMDRKLTQVKPGTMIEISFDKMTPTPNGSMYKYRVRFDKNNTIEVAGSDLDSAYEAQSSQNEDEEFTQTTEDNDSYASEEDTQSAALAIAERKAKVEALLKNKNRATR